MKIARILPILLLLGLPVAHASQSQMFICKTNADMYGKIGWSTQTKTAIILDGDGRIQHGTLESVTNSPHGATLYQMKFFFSGGVLNGRTAGILVKARAGVFKMNGFIYTMKKDSTGEGVQLVEKFLQESSGDCLYI